jgi:predicted ArsR family transcriptional regulator
MSDLSDANKAMNKWAAEAIAMNKELLIDKIEHMKKEASYRKILQALYDECIVAGHDRDSNDNWQVVLANARFALHRR